MSLRKLASDTVIYGLSSIIGRLLGFLLVPLYTNLDTISTADYGVVTFFYAIIAFLGVVFIYRMETAYFRYGTQKEYGKKTFSTGLFSLIGTTVFFAGIILLFSKSITINLIGYPADFSIFVSLSACILAFDVLSEIPMARLRLEEKAMKFAGIKLTNIGLNIGLNLFFLLACPWILEQESWAGMHGIINTIYDSEFGIGYIFLSNFIASLATLLLVLPLFRKLSWSDFDPQLWRKMFIYALPLVLAGLAGIANELLDRVLIKYMLPEDIADAQLGIYGACYKLAMLMSLFTQAFRYAAEPFFFKNANQIGAKKMYAAVGKYFAIVGVLGFLVITFYLDIFQHFVGEDYREGLVVVPILLLANLFLGLYYNLSIWYKLTDKTIVGGYLMGIGAVITIVLNICWLPKIGYLGSAWATLICYFSVTVLSYFWGKKYYDVPYDIARIGLYIVVAIGFYFLLEIYRPYANSLLQAHIFATALLGLYLTGIYWLEKKEFFIHFLNKKTTSDDVLDEK